MVDAADVVHCLGEPVNTRQGLAIEDISLFDNHRHHHVVGAAEGVANGVVQLDVLVFLRQ